MSTACLILFIAIVLYCVLVPLGSPGVGKLPYINMTVDCSGNVLVWNYTQQAINAGLDYITEVIVEYNITNGTSGDLVSLYYTDIYSAYVKLVIFICDTFSACR